jgi:cephalosporin-C deacetylase-like acetyl esterase
LGGYVMGVKDPIGYKLKKMGYFVFMVLWGVGRENAMDVKDTIGNQVKGLHVLSLVDNCQHMIIKWHEDIDQKLKL